MQISQGQNNNQQNGAAKGIVGSENDYVGLMNATIRRGFIRKVYSILAVQLLVTFGIVYLFSTNAGVSAFVQRSPGMFWSAWILTIVLLVAMACFEKARRQYPLNYAFLGAFTLCEGYLIGVISSFYSTTSVMYAVVVTMIVVLGLTAFAFQTKIDFTMMSGTLCCVLIVFIMFGFLSSVFCATAAGCRTANIVYSCLGALIFSVYLVYDTQLLVGGKHRKYQLSPDEYVFAALNLYLDVVMLFIYILALFGGGGSGDSD